MRPQVPASATFAWCACILTWRSQDAGVWYRAPEGPHTSQCFGNARSLRGAVPSASSSRSILVLKKQKGQRAHRAGWQMPADRHGICIPTRFWTRSGTGLSMSGRTSSSFRAGASTCRAETVAVVRALCEMFAGCGPIPPKLPGSGADPYASKECKGARRTRKFGARCTTSTEPETPTPRCTK